MKTLPDDVRRLIVESGLVAVNHGMPGEAQTIRTALGDLVDAPELQKLLDAAMLIGLGAHTCAERQLVGDGSPEAQLLRRMTRQKSTHYRPH